MLTEKTGTNSTWDQFMQVKAQARLRNAGLGRQSVVKSTPTHTVEKTKSLRTVSAQPANGLGITRTGMYRSTSSVQPGKILGGRFDAWA